MPYTGGAAVSRPVFDFDLFVDQAISGNNTTLEHAGVQRRCTRVGAKAICYVDAGTWENWRADAQPVPRAA